MSEPEVIIDSDSELIEGLTGEKIKVTLEGEPVGIELVAEEEAETLVGIDDIELDMLVTAGMEAEIEVLRAEAVEDEPMDEVGVMEGMEVIMDEEVTMDEEEAIDEEAIMDEEGDIDIDIDDEETSSMFIIDSLSSTESDIDCNRSSEAAAGFQSGWMTPVSE